MPKVSIIVPVYNVEKYLQQCLDSLIQQTFSNIEIICINDASTDNSLEILKYYAKKDKRIKILNNKSNMNAGPSRNKGFELANGEYIYFMDSDDYLSLNAIEKVVSIMDLNQNSDFCMFYKTQFNEKTKSKENINTFPQFNIETTTEVSCYENIENFCYGEVPAWLKIYKRSFLVENNIKFDSLKGANDNYFYFQTIFKANKVTLIPEYLIVHRTNVQNSLVMQRAKHFSCMYDSYNLVSKLIEKENSIVKSIIIDITLNNLFYFYNNVSKREQKKLKPGLKKFLSSIDFPANMGNCKTYNWYEQYIDIIKPFTIKKFLKKIFSLKNKDNHKILTILGIKLKFQLELTGKDKKVYKNFINHSVKDNSILMIEINGFHSETLPGMAKYFLDLGYNIDIILSESEYFLDPLHRLRTENLSVYPMSAIATKKILTDKIVDKYKLIYFNSDRFQDKSYFDFLKPSKKLTQKILNLCHRPDEYNSPIKNLMILAPLPLTNKEAFKVVNPHYFGKTINHNKAEITKFIVVGNIENKRKNHNLLYNAVEELVNKGITNFNITVIARCGELNIPENIRQYFDFKGSLNYPHMYDELEKADFFLTLLDPDNPEHDRYITTGTSGSFQLIYGFKKPCLIAEKFAALHGFNLQNSIVYQNNYDLTNAMQTAINMSKEQYHNLQINLAQYADTLYQESLANLKEILKCFQ